MVRKFKKEEFATGAFDTAVRKRWSANFTKEEQKEFASI